MKHTFEKTFNYAYIFMKANKKLHYVIKLIENKKINK